MFLTVQSTSIDNLLRVLADESLTQRLPNFYRERSLNHSVLPSRFQNLNINVLTKTFKSVVVLCVGGTRASFLARKRWQTTLEHANVKSFFYLELHQARSACKLTHLC